VVVELLLAAAYKTIMALVNKVKEIQAATVVKAAATTLVVAVVALEALAVQEFKT
jgi:hypothetical protein